MRSKKRFLSETTVSPSAIKVAETCHKIPALLPLWTRCGKPTCRCTTGHLHGPYWVLRWREGATNCRRYVRQAEVDAVRTVIERRRRSDREARQAVALARVDLRRLRAWLREIETA